MFSFISSFLAESISFQDLFLIITVFRIIPLISQKGPNLSIGTWVWDDTELIKEIVFMFHIL